MEKKLGVFFTTIVTRISTPLPSLSSLTLTPIPKVQTKLNYLLLSLSTIHTLVCIYLFTERLSLALNYSFCCLFSSLPLSRAIVSSPPVLSEETSIGATLGNLV